MDKKLQGYIDKLNKLNSQRNVQWSTFLHKR